LSVIPKRGTWGFAEILLAGVILASAISGGLVLALYVLPREPLVMRELEPAVRIGPESAFPVGAHRVQNWGERIILVVRESEAQYYALQGTSPLDGCILRWDPESLRIVSPCAYVVFDLHGNVVEGLTTVPLRRYSAFVRGGVVYVTEA
jgi:nitrite reductase/ring-hydroxylating ferredoxin subunit